jgi:hypothetical protein
MGWAMPSFDFGAAAEFKNDDEEDENDEIENECDSKHSRQSSTYNF